MLQNALVYGARLSDDGSIIVFCRRVKVDTSEHGYHDEVLLYDWRQQQIIRRYRSALQNVTLIYPRISGSTVVAGDRIVVWQGDPGTPGTKHGLSPDGEMAHACRRNRTGYELVLIDVKRQSIVQVIQGLAMGVFWSSDHSSFLAVDNTAIRRFILKDHQYEPDGNFGTVTLPGHLVPARQNSHYFTVETDTKNDPWRKKMVSWLGKSFTDEIWPEGKVVYLHDTVSGKVMHRVSIPNEWLGVGHLPHPDGQSLGLFSSRSAALLDIYPASRWWYPFFGLVVGAVLSAYLARRLLRQSRRTTSLTRLNPNPSPAAICPETP